MKRKLSVFRCLLAVLISVSLFRPVDAQPQPLTVAEKSNFTATSRYADVMAFLRALQQQTDHLRIETLCRSFEGRDVPLVVLADPVPASPADLRHDPRLGIYIQANIHAGEVEGKESSLMLLRDLVQGKYPDIMKNTVLLVAPIFNADGNEKISPDNRRNQEGPEQGVGVRHNGQMLDINRDGIKAETPEMQGLLQNVLDRWDPILLIDCHTTNGSYHQEPVTFSWPLNPNGDQNILAYMRDTMLPQIQEILKEKYQTLSIPYGNFVSQREPERGWRTFGHEPRYITNYIGLRNRFAILIENYAHADYKTRVMGNYHMLVSTLTYCVNHKDEIRRLQLQADRALMEAQADSFAVEVELKPLAKPLTILGYKVEVIENPNGRPRLRRTDETRTYTVPYFADFHPRRSVRLPVGYLILPGARDVASKLLQHGILVEELLEPVTAEVEAFVINELKSNERLYQGHHMNRVAGKYETRQITFPVGSLFVPTNQPLGKLAATLLEPESDDGLLVWNFFDRHLVRQWGGGYLPVPVYRLMKPVTLVKKRVSDRE